MAALQITASKGWKLELADATNAFCQSDKLSRAKRAIYCEACEGLSLQRGQLIELVAPVYGLNDVPLLWHRTLTGYIQTLGFRKSLLDPCLWLLRRRSRLVSLMVIEVDDLIFSAEEGVRGEIADKLQSSFHFGKWEIGESEYAGKQYPDRIIVNQEKYILEQVRPMKLDKGQRAQTSDYLISSEIIAYRSMAAVIQWEARESRLDVASSASLLNGKMLTHTVQDAMDGIAVCNYLRGSASH